MLYFFFFFKIVDHLVCANWIEAQQKPERKFKDLQWEHPNLFLSSRQQEIIEKKILTKVKKIHKKWKRREFDVFLRQSNLSFE